MPLILLALAIVLPLMKLLGLWAALTWGWALLPGLVLLVILLLLLAAVILFS